MNDENQIKKWLESGIINQEQAGKMLADVNQKSAEEKSNKFISAISIIGAILLGIGAILFVGSNWKALPNVIKVLILLGSTAGSTYLGYLFKYDMKNLPRVGATLFFLGSVLFGASIFLIAQIYHVNANAHILILIWLIGILPLVFAFKSESIAALSAILFYIWMMTYIFRNNDPNGYVWASLPEIALSSSALIFGMGGLLYLKPGMQKVARQFRLASVKVAMLSLFLLTFKTFSEIDIHDHAYTLGVRSVGAQLNTGIMFFSVLAVLGLAANLTLNPPKSKTNNQETLLSLGLLIFMLIAFLFPLGSITHLIYTLMFIPLTLALLYFGYQRSDIELVNTGTFWLAIFILAKYFEYFMDLLGGSLFFIGGGLVLIVGGMELEKKRRQIKQKFSHDNQTSL